MINFLNERNDADRRVLQLLTEKFNLFNGVFGASDEVLGSIESSVDFEKRILTIYQQCRTPDEIETAFKALQAEMDERIQSRMTDTRKLLLENFDEDVHERLRVGLHPSGLTGSIEPNSTRTSLLPLAANTSKRLGKTDAFGFKCSKKSTLLRYEKASLHSEKSRTTALPLYISWFANAIIRAAASKSILQSFGSLNMMFDASESNGQQTFDNVCSNEQQSIHDCPENSIRITLLSSFKYQQ